MELNTLPNFPDRPSDAVSGTHRDWDDKSYGMNWSKFGKALFVFVTGLIFLPLVLWLGVCFIIAGEKGFDQFVDSIRRVVLPQ